MDLELLYFNNAQLRSDNCDRGGPPTLLLGPFGCTYHHVSDGTVTWAVPATEGIHGHRVVARHHQHAPHARCNRFSGEVGALELVYDSATQRWEGSRAFAGTTRVTYVIQAVDKRGNVTWLDYAPSQLPSSGVPPQIPDPVDVTVTPPAVPTITCFTPT